MAGAGRHRRDLTAAIPDAAIFAPPGESHRPPRTLPRMPVALEWGPVGARTLAERSDVVVVVDVLSFSTALTVAVERGAVVWPHTGGESARQLARDIGAVLAGNRSTHEGLTLSPESLLGVDEGTRLVLPSPNGSSIAFAAVNGGIPVVAGCLRNAAAVSRYLDAFERIALVPAGEQWGDGSLRPAYEDLVGAGAVVDRLSARDPGVRLAPEAEVAALAFRSLRPLELCVSGAELVERGFASDVRIASEIDVTDVVPVLVDGRFVAA
jgi:2-phosphosulfolactate phosphatase